VVLGAQPLMAEIAVLDPELTVGLPPNLTAFTGMDAMTHAVEAFVCPIFHPMCDAIALEAIRLIRLYLPQAYSDGTDLEARGFMQVAAAMGAVAFQTALGLGQLAMEAGVPEGILQVLPGRSSEIGDYLVSHSLVDKITLTGETGTGAHIVRLAADDIKRVSLELGGKNPNIVFADADVTAAAAAAPMAVFANTGQDCCARSRVLVENRHTRASLRLLSKQHEP